MTSSDKITILVFLLTIVIAVAGYFFRQFSNKMDKLSETISSLDKTIAVLSNRVDHLERKNG